MYGLYREVLIDLDMIVTTYVKKSEVFEAIVFEQYIVKDLINSNIN